MQGFINKSKILYVEPNKERTHTWLKVNRLKLPLLSSSTYGFFNNSISQNSKNVNTKNDESSNDIKYSMGGLKAETADKSALEKAMELEKDGTDSEKIRKETGWFKGYDGKWRFEIDNSELEFKTDIEKNRAAAIELAKMKVKSAELEEKIVNDTATKAEENVQTMYSGKNKESLATTPSENKSLSQTSETLSGTASYKILAHEGNKVNIKENDNISDIKYATDDTIQSEKYDNLETLDDKEIKVYNKREWAYGLFNREDMKLLNEKFSELDKRLNGKTDNMLADGTRVVEINNKIVSIGGTYNDPEIYSVFEINAYHEYEAERIKDDIKYVQTGNGRNRYSFEELGKLIENYKGKENVRFYSSTDYSYIRGRTEKGARAISTGDFSRYGYNKESNIRGTSDANAKGEVSAVQLDEDTSDIKYATDDTINDWLDDESTPQGIDFDKAVEKNPVIAVAKIYKSAAQTAKSGLAQGKNVKLDEKEYLRIAGSIMQTYGIKGKYNPNYKKELASQLKNFVDSIGKKDANFTDLFEEFVNDCKGGILLSGEYDTMLMKDEREFVLDLIHDKTLFIRPRDIQQIEEDYGSVANYRKKMFGKTYVAVKNKESGNGRLTNLRRCSAMQRITLRQKVKK